MSTGAVQRVHEVDRLVDAFQGLGQGVAGIIVGAGGTSWELTRQLIKNLPAMIVPRWVANKTQPIGIDDVVRYLGGVVDEPAAFGRVFEIGGPEVSSRARDKDGGGGGRGAVDPSPPQRRPMLTTQTGR